MAYNQIFPQVAQPDFGNMLRTVAALRQADNTNALTQLQMEALKKKTADQDALRTALPGAMSGDQAALGQVAALNPELYMKLDDRRKALVKEATDRAGRLLLAVEQAPPEQRPQAYAAARADQVAWMQQNGLGDGSKIPPTYDPTFVRGKIAEATSVAQMIQQAEAATGREFQREQQDRGFKQQSTLQANQQAFTAGENEKNRANQKEIAGAGKTADERDRQILLRGDPSTPEYAAAYANLAAPRTIQTDQGLVTVNPDLSWARKPGTAAAPAPAQAAPAPAAGGPVDTVPNPVAPPAAPTQPAPAAQPGQPTLSVIQPKGLSSKQQADLQNARTEAATIVSALEDFRATRKAAGFGEQVSSVAGASTPLNASYNIAALLAKGDELFKLGVLNGPDLDIIRRTLPDPSTLSGSMTSDANTEASINKVIDLIQTRIAAKEKQMGVPVTNLRAVARGLKETNPGGEGDGGGTTKEALAKKYGVTLE